MTSSFTPRQKFALYLSIAFFFAASTGFGQMMLKPLHAGEPITLLPGDAAVFESPEFRNSLPCTVTARKAELGFDLRFHSGYEITIPFRELSGDGSTLTVVFRVYSQGNKEHAAYFVQHFRIPTVEDEAKGDASLQGTIDVGPGKYRVDWLMRDKLERVCSSGWDVEASLSPKDKSIPLLLDPEQIAESAPEPFVNDSASLPSRQADGVNVKLLVNFAPQDSTSASLQRSDTEALVSILKTIQRDAHVAHLSLVALNIGESRVVYRQDSSEPIDFPALGKALEGIKLGTVDVAKLGEKHSETNFLQQLIQTEMANNVRLDAVIFAGPKAMLKADVPQEELRRIGGVECPVFYMNYNSDPQAVPWKDSISHAIRAFKGTEYTISRPRDLWVSTSDMFSRIVGSKRQRAVATSLTARGIH
ncbi:MAG: acetyltransferase [Bryobacteraceae bacterium]